MRNAEESDEGDTPEVRLGRGRRPLERRLRDAKDAMYREHIMDIAEKVFADQGFANTKMQDIASLAGISLGTLYQTYPSKQELHRGLLIERDRQMFDLVMARVGTDLRLPLTVEQILLFMETHLRFLLDHPDYLRMQLQEGYAWYHKSAQPTPDEQQMWDQGLSNLQQVLDWGIGEGVFSPCDTVQQSRMIMALQQTRLANWVMDGMRESHAAVIARIQADFVRMLCLPQAAARMLSADGANLGAKTLKKLRALEAGRNSGTPLPPGEGTG